MREINEHIHYLIKETFPIWNLRYYTLTARKYPCYVNIAIFTKFLCYNFYNFIILLLIIKIFYFYEITFLNFVRVLECSREPTQFNFLSRSIFWWLIIIKAFWSKYKKMFSFEQQKPEVGK